MRVLAVIVALTLLAGVVLGPNAGGAVGSLIVVWVFWLLAKAGCRVIRGAYRMGGR